MSIRNRVTALAAAAILGGGLSAVAAPAALAAPAQGCGSPAPANCVTGTFTVSGIISFTVSTSTFSLTYSGTPGAGSMTNIAAVNYSVTSNDPSGYDVYSLANSGTFTDDNTPPNSFNVDYLDVWGQQQHSNPGDGLLVGQYFPVQVSPTSPGILTTQTAAVSGSGGNSPDSWTDSYAFLSNSYSLGNTEGTGLGIPTTPPGNYAIGLQYTAMAR